MDTFEAIYNRRAVKHYDPEHELTDEEIEKLMQAAIQSPTSFNFQNWRFVLVRDKPLRQEIRAAANDQAQLMDSSLLIVMTADVKAWKKSPERYWRDAPADVVEAAGFRLESNQGHWWFYTANFLKPLTTKPQAGE